MVKHNQAGLLMSSAFQWDLERAERTRELLERYDVRRAKQIIVAAPRPVAFLDLTREGAALRQYLTGVKLRDHVDWADIDTNVPLIIACTPAGRFPIDGRHRLAKALREGLPSLPVIFLTKAETDKVHLTWHHSEREECSFNKQL